MKNLLRKLMQFLKRINAKLSDAADDYVADRARKPFKLTCLMFISIISIFVGLIGFHLDILLLIIAVSNGEWFHLLRLIPWFPICIWETWLSVHYIRHASWHLYARMTGV